MPPIIEVDHVTKEFRLGQLKNLRQTLRNGLARLQGKPPSERARFKALDDVSFSVEPGEVLGIIGHNGAGKSTLLKLLARISQPTSGGITVRGRVAPLIEVGAGLVADMTGRENVFLNATMLGMKRHQIKRNFDEIVAFAELEEFIDTPIKRYSSGMQMRLGFSIATSVESDILIVDEVLAVGDLAFSRKCFDRLAEIMKRHERTLLIVSHNLRQIEKFCSRAIHLDQGHLVEDGEPVAVCNKYIELSDYRTRQIRDTTSRASMRNVTGTGDITLLGIKLLDATGKQTEVVRAGENLMIETTLEANTKLSKPLFSLGVQTTDLIQLIHCESWDTPHLDQIAKGPFRLNCKITRPPLLPGVYSLRMSIGLGDPMHTALVAEDLLSFQIVEPTAGRVHAREGLIDCPSSWDVSAAAECVDSPQQTALKLDDTDTRSLDRLTSP